MSGIPSWAVRGAKVVAIEASSKPKRNETNVVVGFTYTIREVVVSAGGRMTVATNHQQHRTAQCRGGQGPVAASRTAHSPAAFNKHQDRSASVSPGRAGCLLPVGQLGRAFGLGSLSRRADRCRPQFTPVSVDPDEIHELRICELTGRQAVLSRALLSTSGNGPATNTTERTDHDRA